MKMNKKKYEIDGYIKLRNFLPKFLILKIKKELSEIIMEVAKNMSLKLKKRDFNYLINEILPKIYKKDKKKRCLYF